MSEKRKYSVAVIGAGITGAFTAYLLARDGHPVMLLDGETASYRGTSCNPGGINPLHGPGLPVPMAEFYLSSHKLHAQLREEIMSLSGLDYGFRFIDRLFLAFSADEQKQLLAMGQEYGAQPGFTAQWLTPDELKALDERISDSAVGGLFTSGNAIVDSESYCEALLQSAIKLGCRYIKSDVSDVIVAAGRVTHVETSAEKIACEAAIITAGYCTAAICSRLGLAVPVAPLKGELLVVKLPGAPLEFDITRGLSGLYQLRDNLYWLGGTKVSPEDEPGVSDQARRHILAGIDTMLPGVGPLEIIAHEAGYRPESADKLPIVGFLPGYENLLVGTGGGSKGILLSAGIARALRDMIVNGPAAVIPYLSPERFNVVN